MRQMPTDEEKAQQIPLKEDLRKSISHQNVRPQTQPPDPRVSTQNTDNGEGEK